jgi:fibronectin type 3 domain-containing protein
VVGLKLPGALAAIVTLLLVTWAGAAAAANPWRDNGRGPWIAHVCALPIPRVAGCSADVVTNSGGLPLAGSSPAASALGPGQFHSAYNLPTTAPNTQTIGIVDAYDDPNVANDLTTFDNYYGLAAPPSFRKVNQSGGTTSYPAANSGWALEISLDVEMAHAICQNCNILLVEATSNSLANLGAAENEAVKLGATVISNSWGASEYSSETSDETSYFKHAGVAITASAGDGGYGVEFPAASQYVTAVGGTTLTVNANGSYGGETVWSGTGSGCSTYEPKPQWQTDTGCSHRTVNDVAADADPNTGAAVYDTVTYDGQSGWFQVGGTSLASPLIAAVYALAGNPSGVTYGSSPYSATSQLHDVTSGSDGSCGGSYLCTARVGYDGPTGLGTPNGVGAFAGTPSTVPGAPTGLQAMPGNQSVSLQWTAPTNTGGSSITGYNIYRSTTSGAEALVQSGVTGTSYTDSGLANGTTYYYKVAAVNSVGTGALSGEASATPAATKPGPPTGLQATAGNGSVALAWSAPTNTGGSPISSYTIYRGTSSGQETVLKAGVTGTSYTDTGLVNGTTYYYEVTATNGIGEGAASSEVSATPATTPGAPTLNQPTTGTGSVSLSWTPPTSTGGSNITGYNIYRGTSSGGETLLTSGVSGTSYTDSSVVGGTTYYYEVVAVNGVGPGAMSNEVSATPAAPAGDFSLSISPSSAFIGSSASTTFTVSITPSNGFSGKVTLSIAGLPAHVSGSFSPNPATSSSTLTITASGAAFGRVTFTVTGTSGSLTHTATASLFVF